MSKLLRSALCALTLSLAPLPAAAQDVDPALWVVRDADTTIYLFGTVHVMKPGLGWFDEAVKTAFDASGELVLEMVEPPEAELRALVMRMAVASDGRTLTEKLPEASRADLAKALAALGKPATMLDRFEPWFAIVMLSGMQLPGLGYDPSLGADHVLTDAARAAGKKLVGFETPEGQLGMFDAAPEAQQIEYFGNLLDELDRIAPMTAQIMSLWGEGKPDVLGDALNAEMAKTPELAKRFLFDRNARWTDWIAERMKAPGTVFVAVGAGHLGGKGNVRELLARRGLRVERVVY
ncbi:MAG: TraB/GumN family protein [Pseudomonadota bacterium]